MTRKLLSKAQVTALLWCSTLIPLLSNADERTTIHLFTEDFPPMSMAVDNATSTSDPENITGYSTLIVTELFRRADINYTLELVPWKRAYESALENKNHGVFSTTRTPEREQLFHWISPLVENDWVLMGRPESTFHLQTLQQANNYRIGGYLGDAIAAHLEQEGLTFRYVANDVPNVRKLARNRIDLWPVVQLKGHWLAKSEGESVKELFLIKRTIAGLALNKNTDQKIIEKLQQALNELYQDGTIEQIKATYLTVPQ